MKKAWIKVMEGSVYEDLAPFTLLEQVYMDDQKQSRLSTKLADIETKLKDLDDRLIGALKDYERAKVVVSSTEPAKEENTIWIKP